MTISPCSFAGKVSPALFTTKTSLPGIARPTGNAEYFSKIERSIRTEVVATVASVGPYMFHTWARGKRSSKRAAVCAASVSPQKRKRRMRGSIPSENFSSTRHICANDGVETHVVEPEFPRARDCQNFVDALLRQYCVERNVGPAGFYRSEKRDEHLRLPMPEHRNGRAIIAKTFC